MTNPILLDIPNEMETARLLMRTPRNGDGKYRVEAIAESLTELRAWGASLPWSMYEPSVDASESYCREAQANFVKRSELVYSFYSKQNGQFIGVCSLHSIVWNVPKFEIGYWCRTSQHNHGYVSEAVTALCALAFSSLGARRVWCQTDDLNVASKRVCEKVGMSIEATLRNERVGVGGELRDTCIYAITR